MASNRLKACETDPIRDQSDLKSANQGLSQNVFKVTFTYENCMNDVCGCDHTGLNDQITGLLVEVYTMHIKCAHR